MILVRNVESEYSSYTFSDKIETDNICLCAKLLNTSILTCKAINTSIYRNTLDLGTTQILFVGLACLWSLANRLIGNEHENQIVIEGESRYLHAL